MTHEEIFKKVQQIIADNDGEPDCQLGDNIEHIGLDSLDMLGITIDLEKEFNITISDAEHDRVQLVMDWVNLVKSKIQ